MGTGSVVTDSRERRSSQRESEQLNRPELNHQVSQVFFVDLFTVIHRLIHFYTFFFISIMLSMPTFVL